MSTVSLEKKTTGRSGREPPMPVPEFEAAIRAVGPERYHDLHPFHHMLHGGKLIKGQVQAWALNRYCYQAAVPRKDAALISRVHDRELRRAWMHRPQFRLQGSIRCNAVFGCTQKLNIQLIFCCVSKA